MATIAAHRTEVVRSAIDRPTSTADRHIGSVRNLSMMPSWRSVLRPTAVPMVDVTRFIARIPARTNSL